MINSLVQLNCWYIFGWQESNFSVLVWNKSQFFFCTKMNFNQSNTLLSVRWPFAIFLLTSRSLIHRTSGLYLQYTQPSAIGGHRNYWKFYHLKSFVNFEINDNLAVQDRGCMGMRYHFLTKFPYFGTCCWRCSEGPTKMFISKTYEIGGSNQRERTKL